MQDDPTLDVNLTRALEESKRLADSIRPDSDRWDVIVVGSGAAGGMAAFQLGTGSARLGRESRRCISRIFTSLGRTVASPGRTSATATSTGARCDRAFDDAGYRGYFTTEVAAGEAAYLKDLAGRVDRFLSGQKPV